MLRETQEIKVAKFHVNKPQAKCPFDMKLCCRLKNQNVLKQLSQKVQQHFDLLKSLSRHWSLRAHGLFGR